MSTRIEPINPFYLQVIWTFLFNLELNFNFSIQFGVELELMNIYLYLIIYLGCIWGKFYQTVKIINLVIIKNEQVAGYMGWVVSTRL